jgi:hypothetical protein
MFQRVRASVVGEDRSGRPTTSRTANSVERIDVLVQEDRRITVTDTGDKLDISCAYIPSSTKTSSMTICARWVPKQLPDEYKRTRVERSIQFLQQCCLEGQNVLQQIVTVDEICVHRYEPAIKRQSVGWKHNLSPMTKKFRSVPSAGKMILTLFWDFNGPILQDHGQMVSSAWYYAMLEEVLKTAIRIQCAGMMTNGVILHHDNA